MSELYLLDTSFLINGWRLHYPPSVFAGVWSFVDEQFNLGKVISCQGVFRELIKKDDEIAEWAKTRKQFFRDDTEEFALEFGRIMAQYPNFAAAGGSTNEADPQIIVHAKLTGATVVTYEECIQTKVTKPPKKIPFVCEELGIPWASPVKFLELAGLNL